MYISLKENRFFLSTSWLHILLPKSKNQNIYLKLSKADNGTSTICRSQAVLLSKTTLSVKEIAHIIQKTRKKVIWDVFQTERLRIVPKLGIQLSLTSNPLDCVQLSLDGAPATPGICKCIWNRHRCSYLYLKYIKTSTSQFVIWAQKKEYSIIKTSSLD